MKENSISGMNQTEPNPPLLTENQDTDTFLGLTFVTLKVSCFHCSEMYYVRVLCQMDK